MGQRDTYHKFVGDDPQSRDEALRLFRGFYKRFNSNGILQSGVYHDSGDIMMSDDINFIEFCGPWVFLINTIQGVYIAAIGFENSKLGEDNELTLRLGIETTSTQDTIRKDLEGSVEAVGFKKDTKGYQWNQF
ncbi:hypothetical protein J4221_05295 [Candidatus Pacearchaeota archaeon]|nr:hypothetical protein [Candidatus Pacearchaeota archaeon]